MEWFRNLKTNSLRVDCYFYAAVSAYVIEEDDNAFHAAFAASTVMAREQRSSAVSGLLHLGKSLKTAAAGDFSDLIETWKNRINQLADLVSSEDWSDRQVIAAKNELDNLDEEYLQALDRADPTVFIKRYPENQWIRRLLTDPEVQATLPHEALNSLDHLGVEIRS
jgi:hypothetical protein